MPSHNALIRNALARSVRAGTVLQDAILKVRHARQQSSEVFEIALGELFVLSSGAFRERNGLRQQVAELQQQLAASEEEIKRLSSGQ